MKKMFFVVVLLSLFSFSGKAQWSIIRPNIYDYYNRSYQNQNIVQRYDIGPYGYGQIQDEIMRFGYITGPYSFQRRETISVNILGRVMRVEMIGNLDNTYAGSVVWIDYYLNGVKVGQTNFEGRFATDTFWRSSLDYALDIRRRYR